jgi:hypothetical protein
LSANTPTVPIYDARKANLTFLGLLSDLSVLKPYPKELPRGSCTIIAYTVNTWGKTEVNVSFNVRWAMVLSTPGKM